MSGLLRSSYDFNQFKSTLILLVHGLRRSISKVKYALIRRYQYTIRWSQYHKATPRATQSFYVDPDDVEFIIWPHFYSELCGELTYIRSGEWDESISHSLTGHWGKFTHRKLIPLKKYIPYISFKQHFVCGVPWEETAYFDQALYSDTHDRLGTPESPRWEKFEEWDNMYIDMKKNGYNNKKDILIDIGRDGKLILDDGRHRLMAAKILDIDKVPVRVLVRHKKWQRFRCEISTSNVINVNKFSKHPDLKQLIQ